VKQGLRDQYGHAHRQDLEPLVADEGLALEAGLVNTGTHRYEIEWSKVEDLTGMTSDELLDLDGLTDEQRAFLHTLAILDPDGYIQNTAVRKVAEEIHGIDISQSKVSDLTLNPLEELGYIEWENPSEVTGKPNLVKTTDQFDAEVLDPVLEDVADRIGIPRHVLRLSFEEVTEQLDSKSTYEKESHSKRSQSNSEGFSDSTLPGGAFEVRRPVVRRSTWSWTRSRTRSTGGRSNVRTREPKSDRSISLAKLGSPERFKRTRS